MLSDIPISLDGLLLLSRLEDYIAFMDEVTVVRILVGDYVATPSDIALWEVKKRESEKERMAENIEKSLSKMR